MTLNILWKRISTLFKDRWAQLYLFPVLWILMPSHLWRSHSTNVPMPRWEKEPSVLPSTYLTLTRPCVKRALVRLKRQKQAQRAVQLWQLKRHADLVRWRLASKFWMYFVKDVCLSQWRLLYLKVWVVLFLEIIVMILFIWHMYMQYI